MNQEMDVFVEDTLWSVSQRIESLSYKVGSAADVIEVIAAETSEEPTSGALWFMRDALKALADEIVLEADKLLEDRKALKDSIKSVKGKKSK
jgi:chloramphenicol 3-O-phosphotransferase